MFIHHIKKSGDSMTSPLHDLFFMPAISSTDNDIKGFRDMPIEYSGTRWTKWISYVRGYEMPH